MSREIGVFFYQKKKKRQIGVFLNFLLYVIFELNSITFVSIYYSLLRHCKQKSLRMSDWKDKARGIWKQVNNTFLDNSLARNC
jgi:uncharacterized ion transporter superfamily protein YfcC